MRDFCSWPTDMIRVDRPHCHLADDGFAADLDEVVAAAQAAGVDGALCILSATSAEGRARRAVQRPGRRCGSRRRSIRIAPARTPADDAATRRADAA